MILSIFRFLASIWFALTLIFLTAIFVVIGTFVEAKTVSHASAETWIYHHPLFKLLLGGYFINILFSALRRCPFQKRHIPFLMTHLGLLMVISGIFLKSLFGIQGHLYLVEGTTTDLLTLPHEKALSIEKKSTGQTSFIPLKEWNNIEIYPHGKEKYFGWMDEKAVLLLGYKPILLHETPYPIDMGLEKPLFVFGSHHSSLQIALEETLGANYQVYWKNKKNEIIDKIPLKTALKKEHGLLKAHLKDFSLFIGPEKELTEIALQGDRALLHRGNFRYDLKGQPFLLIHQDTDLRTTLIVGDENGRLFHQVFDPQKKEHLVAYDSGFSGYGFFANVPFYQGVDRFFLETLEEERLTTDLKNGKSPLSPPLELIRKSALNHNFDESQIIHFLLEWADQKKWLYDGENLPFLKMIQWDTLSKGEVKALYWIASLIDENEFLKHLRELHWPLLQELEEIDRSNLPLEEKEKTLFTTWMYQLYAIREELPPPPTPLEEFSSQMLSAFFRLYQIHYDNIKKVKFPLNPIQLTLETPLKRMIEAKASPTKIEEATPLAKICWKGEMLSLVYDPKGTGLKWPTRDRSLLIRFQPLKIPLPYEIRLNKASDIKYPGGDRTMSYECTLSLKSKNNGQLTRCRLRMNQVHETEEGYRFYLSGMGQIDRLGVHAVQIVVSKDPAKLWLTYPGGGLIALGAIFLFWPSRRKYFS